MTEITTTKILGVGLEYTKQDDNTKKTVYIKIPNPSNGLTESNIKEKFLTLINGNEPVFKTPDNQSFNTETAIFTAYTETVTKTDYDIGVQN